MLTTRALYVLRAWANIVSRRWSVLTRATLHALTIILALASLAVYGGVIDVAPSGAPSAFVFVIVTPVSWLFIGIVPLIARISRRGSGQGDAAALGST